MVVLVSRIIHFTERPHNLNFYRNVISGSYSSAAVWLLFYYVSELPQIIMTSVETGELKGVLISRPIVVALSIMTNRIREYFNEPIVQICVGKWALLHTRIYFTARLCKKYFNCLVIYGVYRWKSCEEEWRRNELCECNFNCLSPYNNQLIAFTVSLWSRWDILDTGRVATDEKVEGRKGTVERIVRGS